jgi:hypothetical protein
MYKQKYSKERELILSFIFWRRTRKRYSLNHSIERGLMLAVGLEENYIYDLNMLQSNYSDLLLANKTNEVDGLTSVQIPTYEL